MLSAAVQILAFVLALLGVLCATVSTLLPNWKVSLNAWSGVMMPVSQLQGLWMDCVVYSSGVFSCTMKSSLLSLPPHLQAARAAMVLSIMVAAFGLCLASLGLKCTRWGGDHRAKGHTAVAAGGCFITASFLCLGSASWFTSEVITAFLTSDLPDSSRFQPGGALCVGFVSAGFLLAAGVIFCLSCPGNASRHPGPAPSTCSTTTDRPMADKHQWRSLNTEHETPNKRQSRSVQQQTDQKMDQEPGGQSREVRDSYSLQEYV